MAVDADGNEVGKLFVGGLHQSTNTNGLHNYFSKYGDIEESVVMMDNKTGRSRGFGYVKFKEPSSVDQVLSEKVHIIDNKEVDPKRCNINMRGKNKRSLKIFVGGISFEHDEEFVRNFFQQYGNVTDVNLLSTPGRPRHRGFAFVGFDDEEVVKKLIKLHYVHLGGKQVEIKPMEPPNVQKSFGLLPPAFLNTHQDRYRGNARFDHIPQNISFGGYTDHWPSSLGGNGDFGCRYDQYGMAGMLNSGSHNGGDWSQLMESQGLHHGHREPPPWNPQDGAQQQHPWGVPQSISPLNNGANANGYNQGGGFCGANDDSFSRQLTALLAVALHANQNKTAGMPQQQPQQQQWSPHYSGIRGDAFFPGDSAATNGHNGFGLDSSSLHGLNAPWNHQPPQQQAKNNSSRPELLNSLLLASSAGHAQWNQNSGSSNGCSTQNPWGGAVGSSVLPEDSTLFRMDENAGLYKSSNGLLDGNSSNSLGGLSTPSEPSDWQSAMAALNVSQPQQRSMLAVTAAQLKR